MFDGTPRSCPSPPAAPDRDYQFTVDADIAHSV
jgi:hypothetical protein